VSAKPIYLIMKSTNDYTFIADESIFGSKTVTNAADEIVRELYEKGVIWDGKRLFYKDSAGDIDELLHENGAFTGFSFGCGEYARKLA
jgi:hypothetical protein